MSLATLMRGQGADIFVDQARLKGGDDFVERLAQEIERRDGVVLLLTAAGASSRWVQGEAAWALQCGKRVVPVVSPDASLARFLFLAHVQQLRLDNTDQEELVRLAQTIVTLFGPGPQLSGSDRGIDEGALGATTRSIAEEDPATAALLVRRFAELDPSFLAARQTWDGLETALRDAQRSDRMSTEARSVYRQAASAFAARAFDAMEVLLDHGARTYALRDDPLRLLRGRPITPNLVPFVRYHRTLPLKGQALSFSHHGTHLLMTNRDDLLIVEIGTGIVARRRRVGPGRFGEWLRRRTWTNLRYSYGGYVSALALSRREDAVAFGRDDGRWGVWYLRDDSVRWLQRVRGRIEFVALDEDAALCYSSGARHVLAVRTVGFPRTRRLRDRNFDDAMDSFAVSANHLYVSWGSRIRVWGEDSEGPLFVVSLPGRHNARQLSVTPDGRYLAAMSRGRVTVWALPDLRLISETPVDAEASRLELSHDARILFVSAGDEIQALDRISGKELLRIPRGGREFAVSPVGDLIAITTEVGTELWGLA